MASVFVPSVAGVTELTRSVEGPLGVYLDGLADRVLVEAVAECPVAPPPEFPPGRWAHEHLRDTHERSRVYPTADGLAVRVGTPAPYAASVHDGSRAHPIRARFAKTLRFRNKRNVVVFPVAVNHPGTRRPNRWLERAVRRVLGA